MLALLAVNALQLNRVPLLVVLAVYALVKPGTDERVGGTVSAQVVLSHVGVAGTPEFGPQLAEVVEQDVLRITGQAQGGGAGDAEGRTGEAVPAFRVEPWQALARLAHQLAVFRTAQTLPREQQQSLRAGQALGAARAAEAVLRAGGAVSAEDVELQADAGVLDGAVHLVCGTTHTGPRVVEDG